MIEADGDVEILDKNIYILPPSRKAASSTWKCASSADAGYISADKNFDADLGLGFIPWIVHSPVRRVNYVVEAARLGQITDYDKLTLEVWTNGAVLPPTPSA